MKREERQLCEMRAEMFKALAHPLRVAVVEFLAEGEQCVCDIVAHLGAEQSNVSRHLALMVRAGVLVNRKAGLQVYYRLQCECVADFLTCVNSALRERIEGEKALLDGRPAMCRSRRAGRRTRCVKC